MPSIWQILNAPLFLICHKAETWDVSIETIQNYLDLLSILQHTYTSLPIYFISHERMMYLTFCGESTNLGCILQANNLCKLKQRVDQFCKVLQEHITTIYVVQWFNSNASLISFINEATSPVYNAMLSSYLRLLGIFSAFKDHLLLQYTIHVFSRDHFILPSKGSQSRPYLSLYS